MANSTRKRILDDIKTTLAAITTGGGYNFTVGGAQRGYRHFNSVPEDAFPYACIAGADEKRRNVTNRELRSDVLASIVGWVKITGDANDTAAVEQAIDNLIEDFTKALYVDITRGGIATLTEIGDIETDKGAFAPYGMFEMIVRCEYRAAVTAP